MKVTEREESQISQFEISREEKKDGGGLTQTGTDEHGLARRASPLQETHARGVRYAEEESLREGRRYATWKVTLR
jgi:hypothetical protein